VRNNKLCRIFVCWEEGRSRSSVLGIYSIQVQGSLDSLQVCTFQVCAGGGDEGILVRQHCREHNGELCTCLGAFTLNRRGRQV
jgi:hypothetical protein